MSNDTGPRPIDEEQAIPAPAGTNAEYLTRDIEVQLEREVQQLLDVEQRINACGRRQAAIHLTQRLQALRHLITP